MTVLSDILRRMADDELVTRIAYDGPVLRDGTMDVRELAPALLSVGELLQGANRVLNGDRASLAVKVRSDFKSGSFDVDLVLLVNMAQHFALAVWPTIYSAKQLAEWVGFTTGTQLSVFGLLKLLRGRKAQKTTRLGNGDIELTLKVEGDNNSVSVHVVPSPVYEIASDPSCRQAVEGVVKPLHAEGIDVFETKQGDKTIERVSKDDLPAFSVPAQPTEDLGPPQKQTLVLAVIKPSFVEDLTWTFSDGATRFDATVKDRTFLSRVSAGEDFRVGDYLRVRLETHQSMTAGTLRTKREVVEVVEAMKAPRQMNMLPQPEPEVFHQGTPKPRQLPRARLGKPKKVRRRRR
jgi:hypothetical protein